MTEHEQPGDGARYHMVAAYGSEDDALARLAGETARAYAAFLDYVRLGDGRSLRRLYESYLHGEKRPQTAHKAPTEKPPTLRFETLADWSVRYRWQERLVAWQTERQRREQALWEQRRAEVRETDWQLGQALREQAERLLATATWDTDALLKAIELASRLQRLAAEVPPPVLRQTHDIQLSAPPAIAFIRVMGDALSTEEQHDERLEAD